jgi:hypothetical protein
MMDEIAFAGDYAYVASEFYGLRVIHLNDPRRPVQVASYNQLIWPWNVAVKNGLAYVADIYNGLAITDVSDPRNPVLAASDGVYGEWNSISVDGKYAYLISESWLRTVDITDPNHPTAAGELFFSPGGGGDRGVDIAVSGTNAYVASFYGGLLVIDIREPTAPVVATQIPGVVNAVAVEREYLYTASESFHIWDISQPDSPVLLASYPISSSLYIEAISPAGRYVYLLSNTGSDNRVRGRLSIMDLADPSNPVLVSSLDLPTGYFVGMDADGDSISLINTSTGYSDGWKDTGGLFVVKVSQPAAPVIIGSYSFPSINNVTGVDAQDGKIYVATNEGLSILRLGYTISGMVQHANGQPYAGAVVSIGALGVEAITSADGRYTLNGLLSGAYTLSARGNAAPTKSTLQNVTLPPDVTHADMTLLPAAASVDLAPGAASSLVFTDTQGLSTSLDFPAGSVTEPTTITLEPILVDSSTWLASTGHAFYLEASQGGYIVPKFSFASPTMITIRYSDQDLRGSGKERGLRILRWYKDAWQDPRESCGSPDDYTQNLEDNTISAAFCQAGTYALFVPAYQAFFPVMP